jgi:TolB-like protein/Flp pilus assembly protein TadD
MFTDMVGYSALTHKDEALALALLEEHRKILRPFFGKHEGREIETAGDAFFVEFNSAVEAAHCAIDIQEALHRRNNTEPPERHILLRIGLHIGDVVYIDQHVHGDGVNIAARMEPLAQPGGICISEDVARQVRNKIPYPVQQLGAEKLKNIALPMDIYGIVLPWLKPGKKPGPAFGPRRLLPYGLALLAVLLLLGWLFYFNSSEGRKAPYPKDRLAVLPLANISQDAKDEYFADGMTEELISRLSQINDLNIIARTSVMKYKNSTDDITEIGRALMVGTILEGSVRKSGDKVRVTIQLIDVNTQEHLWSRDYDRELKDIFHIQSEIARQVAHELQVRLAAAGPDELKQRPTADMAAFEEYLVGRYFLNKKNPESLKTAITHFENAIARDARYALPYASLAYAYTLAGVAGQGLFPREEAARKAKATVRQALALDADLAEAHAALGYVKFRFDWDWPGAEKEFRRAIALKPGYATAHEWYGLFLAIQGRPDEALQEMQKAHSLDPLAPTVNTGLARIYQYRGEYDRALAQINKTLALDSSYVDAYFTKGSILNDRKEYNQALISLNKAVALSGRRPELLGALGLTYANMGKLTEARKMLAELETPPLNNGKLFSACMIKSQLGQPDEIFPLLEKLVDEKFGPVIYIKMNKDMIQGIDGPRYQRLLKKMGLD